MKLKSLHIDSHRHLQNLDFDFTYPEGHAKAGKPLEKICLIGQSATGKTTILEMIKDSISQLERTEIFNDQYIFHHYLLNFKGRVEYLYKDVSIRMTDDKISKNGIEFKNLTSGGGAVGSLIPDGLKLLYLSSEIISVAAINIFNQNPINILSDSSTLNHPRLQELYKNSNYIFEFGQEVDPKTWISLLNDILDYRKRFTQMASELINKGAIGDLSKLNKQYSKWSETNPNPLVNFANFFNPILNKLNLEIDLVNTEFTIPIKSKIRDEIVPISGLSTGTKGLLLSMFPLFELDTSDAIIIIDEPERSLFPDVQIDLITHYQNLASNAQFIVATHSPFIAAAFEPEERFILYFDEDGKVAVRRGESPIGDDPNDMLRNDFHVSYYNEFGKAAYKEYLNLQRRAKQEKEPAEKRKLVVEMAKLGNKYNF